MCLGLLEILGALRTHCSIFRKCVLGTLCVVLRIVMSTDRGSVHFLKCVHPRSILCMTDAKNTPVSKDSVVNIIRRFVIRRRGPPRLLCPRYVEGSFSSLLLIAFALGIGPVTSMKLFPHFSFTTVLSDAVANARRLRAHKRESP